jgi:hypothetical protein
MSNDELPHEVILAIQRVLEIQPAEEIDRLDGLSEKFNAVEILNDFFPNGVCRLPFIAFGSEV